MHSTYVTLNEKVLVGLDLDFGDALRIDQSDDSVVVLSITSDAALAKLIASAQTVQSLRRARGRSCGHVECADASGHIDECRMVDPYEHVR